MFLTKLKRTSEMLDSAPEPIPEVSLRPATAADHDFLLAVFSSTRADELQALAWNPIQAQAFINIQFNAQQQSYRSNYPSAENNIIFLGEEPIGRILVDRSGDAIHLVDIAILTNYRKRHVGSTLLENLIAEAVAGNKPVEFSVFKENPAVRFYERLGFSKVADDGAYLRMRKLPDASATSS